MLDLGRYQTLAEMLADVDDLNAVSRALVRERVIRDCMVESGESRAIVADMLDAAISMDQEGVLDLMEGEPTTLAAALSRYVEELEGRDELQPRDRIVSDLETLLAYPWPGGPELEIRRRDETVEVMIGGEVVAEANHDEHGYAGMDLLESAARDIHKAVTRANK